MKNTSLIGGNFVRCNMNGSEFENVDISVVNFNGAFGNGRTLRSIQRTICIRKIKIFIKQTYYMGLFGMLLSRFLLDDKRVVY
ncbi:unnamed protein product [Paramecium primaurelia]|uniref:Pentapeptide repeat-containing protein n=1 Tax=Paramecium primaurelia TaxID=5886 RepID=A0A8S1PLY3_PARPR|nr:unnamed protein product [Paramecium primaurelia]